MTSFVDTSALFALLDEDDSNHAAAADALARLRGVELVTHTYVIVETLTLVARRLGWAAVERLLDAILPLVGVNPVDAPIHEAALRAYRATGSSQVSLVDQTSFAFMHAHRLETAFAFDEDFGVAGFDFA